MPVAVGRSREVMTESWWKLYGVIRNPGNQFLAPRGAFTPLPRHLNAETRPGRWRAGVESGTSSLQDVIQRIPSRKVLNLFNLLNVWGRGGVSILGGEGDVAGEGNGGHTEFGWTNERGRRRSFTPRPRHPLAGNPARALESGGTRRDLTDAGRLQPDSA